MASLAPIGPIRLAPTPVGQSASTPNKTLNTSKSSNSSVKIPKTAISTNVSLQGVSKIKTIVPSNKTLSNVIPHNYKQVNVSDKSGDAKLMNVFSASGNQIRVNTLSGGKMRISFLQFISIEFVMYRGKGENIIYDILIIILCCL